jgi:hypothetical protein
MTKTAAIFCVWGDANEMIDKAIDNIKPCVDGIIVVHSNISNFGEQLPFVVGKHAKTELWNLEPGLNMAPHKNEIAKRNYGINLARKAGYTHFIVMDFDEFYKQDEFMAEKERVERDNLNGLVCRLKVYFKLPTLCCDDHTLVPFIHKLGPDTRSGDFKDYPFAYDAQGNAHIDPTRRLNYTSGVEMSEMVMHHMSYVRKDIGIKINNSAAKVNIGKSTLMNDYRNAKEGYYCKYYRQTLQVVDNYFNIPEDWIDQQY